MRVAAGIVVWFDHGKLDAVREPRRESAMQLFYSATSPFVRKCLVSALELGVRERLTLHSAAPHPVNRDAGLVARNPLGQVPTLITDEGAVLYDSRVICEYLNTLGDGRLLPEGALRFDALTDQALADGIMAAAVLIRYEMTARPEALRWQDWIDGQMAKVTGGIQDLAQRASLLGSRVDVGTIAVGCALGYLDFRYSDLGWQKKWPALAAWWRGFAERPSMAATRPPA
jgi:glutathione S-transferase